MKLGRNYGIKGFIPISLLDWPGKISSVVFLGGCSFRCPFCHNAKLVLDPSSIPDFQVDHILSYLKSRKAWVDGVTITGGEPTMRRDLPQLLRVFKSLGLKIKLDTNGSNPWALERLISEGVLDAVYMDVKAPLSDHEYSAAAGVSVDVSAILRSIKLLRECGLEVVFRTTVIPGLVEEPQLARIKDALGDVPRYVVQPFRNVETLDSRFSTLPQFELGRLEEMQRLFEAPAPAERFGSWHAAAG